MIKLYISESLTKHLFLLGVYGYADSAKRCKAAFPTPACLSIQTIQWTCPINSKFFGAQKLRFIKFQEKGSNLK